LLAADFGDSCCNLVAAGCNQAAHSESPRKGILGSLQIVVHCVTQLQGALCADWQLRLALK
jgi:hypothetical protein